MTKLTWRWHLAGRLVAQEANNAKQRDSTKVSVNDKAPSNQNQSTSSSPQSMISVLQVPNISSTSKSAKEVRTAENPNRSHTDL